MKEVKKWSSRFEKEMASALIDFNASIAVDKRLALEDIEGSIAHCHMLATQGLISKNEAQLIENALTQIQKEIEQGSFVFRKENEDIHMNIEKRLIEITGDVGRKIHTGRSRNDQVALDTRLFVRKAIDETLAQIAALQEALLMKASKEIDTLMPGYTHLQRAQPVSLAHHLLAYFEMLFRDRERLWQVRKRVNTMPLGSGALAGTTLPLDREKVAKELGFDALTANSMDAVSDRDYVVEFVSSGALLMMHLSRLCEEWILWATSEFGFLEIDDSLCTGSSMMPQKKNPDVPELVRGKTGRVYGNLMALLTIMKGLPLTYNKDLQEDKEPLFDTVDTVIASLQIMTEVVKGTTFRRERLLAAAQDPLLLATDIAEYLVKKNVAFRTAHEVVGQLIRHSIESGKPITEMTLEEFQEISTHFGQDLLNNLNAKRSVDMRDLPGGTARSVVAKAIESARQRLQKRFV